MQGPNDGPGILTIEVKNASAMFQHPEACFQPFEEVRTMGIITESRSKVKPGEKFGRWTVIGVPFSSNYVTRVVVECECGNVAAVNQHSLLSGQSLSCGCHRNDFKITHGQAKKSGVTPLYKCWRAILDRTKRSGHQFWEDYGGRGISVCDEWQQSFENFRNWSVENGYHPSLQLDR